MVDKSKGFQSLSKEGENIKALEKVFEYQGQAVRTVIKDGEIWFVAKDVCDFLGLEQVSRAMDRLEDDERGLIKVTHPQSPDKRLEVNGINEPGLYQLIMASNKPEAKAFKRWVTHEVLPTIRQTGMYLGAGAMMELKGMLNQVYAKMELIQDKVLALEEAAIKKPHPKKITKAGANAEQMVLNMRREGQPVRAIIKALRDLGVMVSRATVYRYCRNVRKKVAVR